MQLLQEDKGSNRYVHSVLGSANLMQLNVLQQRHLAFTESSLSNILGTISATNTIFFECESHLGIHEAGRLGLQESST